MATIGSLQVNIVAKTDKFLSGLKSATTMAGRFVGKVSSSISSLTSLATGANIFAGLVTAAMAKLVDASIEAGEQIFKLTKKLHVSAEGISALHFAADRLGSSAEAVDMGMAKMAETLGKALNGSSEAAIGFGRLGLNTQDLTKLPVEQQFLTIINGLHNITGTNKRAAIAQAIFGRGAKEMAALISAGTDEIIKQSGKAAELGAIMGGEVADGLHKADDAIKDSTSSWAMFKNEFVAASEPVIEWVSWLGTKALQLIQGVFFAIRSNITELVALVAQGVLAIVNTLNKVLPKSMQIDTSTVQSYADSFSKETAKQRGFATDKFNQFMGTGGGQTNPLQAPAGAPAADDHTRAADTLELMYAEMKRVNAERAQKQQVAPTPLGPIVIAPAGVR